MNSTQIRSELLHVTLGLNAYANNLIGWSRGIICSSTSLVTSVTDQMMTPLVGVRWCRWLHQTWMCVYTYVYVTCQPERSFFFVHFSLLYWL